MTVAGFTVCNPGRAVVWADTETYVEGTPNGQQCKISVGVLAGVVGVGCGSMPIVRAAGAVLLGSATLDEAVEELPSALRVAREETMAIPMARTVRWARSLLSASRIAVVGHSGRFGRVVGFMFRAEDDFAPALAHAWCSPFVEAAYIEDEQSALAMAQQQMTEIQRAIPDATGGTLTVAVIEGQRVTAWPAFDLATGARPARRSAPS